MIITHISGELYEYDLARPFADANAVDADDVIHGGKRGLDLAVRVRTDEGIEGIAIAQASALLSLKSLAECVVGHDPRCVRGLWHKLLDANFKLGAQGAIGVGIAAIDNALWDLRAKVSGLPLWKELGALAGRARVYASGLDLALTDDELRDFYTQTHRKLGINAGKLKVGLDIDADLRRLRIVEDALGGRHQRPALMVDANEYWSPKQAIRRMQAIEQEFDITWCEEPVRRLDYRGLRQVSRSIRAAVATGENLQEVGEFALLLRHEAVDVVQLNPYSAGFTTCLRIADLAYAFERPVSVMNSPGRYGAHLAAALPHHIMMEVLDAGRDAVFTSQAVIRGGWIELGDAPGVGIRIDDDLLRLRRATDQDPTGTWLWGTRGFSAAVREAQSRFRVRMDLD
jgi:L-alanine-DL-glutamate epimerase-like enolase superfamily enzyme